MSEKKILLDIATRLGLADSVVVTQKAEEYYRALQNKILMRNLNNSAMAVLCFDLASSRLGINFDKETALKLSGFRKQVYQNHLNNIEKILNLDKPLTVNELCVQQNCTNVATLADEILKKFKTVNNIPEDITYSQYISAAVYTACKFKKVKVQKSFFITASRLKSSKWRELETQFDQFTKENFLESAVRKDDIKFDEVLEDCEKNERKLEHEEEEEDNLEIEDYDMWKERVLREAKEAVEAAMKLKYENE